MDIEKKMEIKVLSDLIDEMDYFQILKLEYDASSLLIKKAYHKESRNYHPDRFFQEDDDELKKCVHKISKRITEAYTVLRNHKKRALYLKAIKGPERKKNLRFSTDIEARVKSAKKEEIGTTPKGREFYRRGMTEMERGNFAEAEKNFKTAMMFEPSNELYKQKYKEARERDKVEKPFWIK